MTKDDLVYVGHMLDFSREVCAFLHAKSRAEFDSERLFRLAVTHLIQNIGEAASHVSPGFKGAHSDIPWGDIVGMRNRIVHGYVDVDDAVVWDAAFRDIPRLVDLLDPLVPPV